MYTQVFSILLLLLAAGGPAAGHRGAWRATSADTTVQHYTLPAVSKKYIHLPVKAGAPKTWVTVNTGGKCVQELEIELAPATPDYYATLEVSQWRGKPLILTAEKVVPGSGWKSLVKTSDKMADENEVYREKYRPQFHFSPRRGWSNDPNGLVYYKGTYHLFFQHVPWGTYFSNTTMSWGHAISKDLVHWEELPVAIAPDKNGVAFSGSAVVDWNNTSGLQQHPVNDKHGKLENPPLVALYTGVAGRRWANYSQCIYYSTDEGRTWCSYENNPVLPYQETGGGDRDPKVYWYKGKGGAGHWVMPLYIRDQTFYLFTSPNLKDWKKTGEINNAGCTECPNLFELPVDGNPADTRWIFWGGAGCYLVGTFDGQAFKKEGGPYTATYEGADYAGQIFSDIPASDGRCIQMAWLRGAYPGMPFSQAMTVPRELTLRSTPEGPRLFINPVREINRLRLQGPMKASGSLQGGHRPFTATTITGELLDMEITLQIHPDKITTDSADIIRILLKNQAITYDAAQQLLRLGNVKAPLAPVDGKINLRVLADRTSLEVFANDGIVALAHSFVPEDDPPPAPAFYGGKGLADIKITAYRLKSIWRKNMHQR